MSVEPQWGTFVGMICSAAHLEASKMHQTICLLGISDGRLPTFCRLLAQQNSLATVATDTSRILQDHPKLTEFTASMRTKQKIVSSARHQAITTPRTLQDRFQCPSTDTCNSKSGAAATTERTSIPCVPEQCPQSPVGTLHLEKHKILTFFRC